MRNVEFYRTIKMDDLERYIEKRKRRSEKFEKNFDIGYGDFKIGVLLKMAREASGLTQEEVAKKLKTKKTAVSRIENHAEDIKLSTISKFAGAIGKKLKIKVV
jgi:ribosome-binding protein aMBF1 (putative translation factor)